MSRYYAMSVEISGHNKDKAGAINEATGQEWPFDDLTTHNDGTMSGSAEGSLCAGEGEEEFSDRLTYAIWKANGAYCKVEVVCTYLENLPCDTYEKDEAAYDAWVAASRS
jgi:hypothetical protein